jgi:hypothetical protein
VCVPAKPRTRCRGAAVRAPASAVAGPSRVPAGPSAAALLGDLGKLSGAELADAIIFWRGQLQHVYRDRQGIDQHIEWVHERYTSVLEGVVAPAASLDAPWVKRIKRGKARRANKSPGGSGKGKGKAREVDEDGIIDILDDGEGGEDDDAKWDGPEEADSP